MIILFWVKVSDSVGVGWHPYELRTEAEAYAIAVDGELFQDVKADLVGERIENAVSKYLDKKIKHIEV